MSHRIGERPTRGRKQHKQGEPIAAAVDAVRSQSAQRLPVDTVELIRQTLEHDSTRVYETLTTLFPDNGTIREQLSLLFTLLTEALETGSESHIDSDVSTIASNIFEQAYHPTDDPIMTERAVTAHRHLSFLIAPMLAAIQSEVRTTLEADEDNQYGAMPGVELLTGTEGLMQFLAGTGEQDADATQTENIFAALNRLHEQDPELFPQFDATATNELLTQIPVAAPYEQISAWIDQATAHNQIRTERGESPIEGAIELIAMRTEHVITELEDRAEDRWQQYELALNSGTPMNEVQGILAVARDYEQLAQWLHDQVQRMQMIGAADARSFRTFMNSVHFLHDSDGIDTVFQQMNALERIKQDDPNLRMRMAGVMVGPDGNATRSDLAGSLFHSALYRSQEIAASLTGPSASLLQDRIRGFTELQRSQTPLFYMPSEATKYLQASRDQDIAELTSPSAGNFAKTLTAVGAIMSEPFRQAAEISTLLSAVSMEERAERMDRLKSGSPIEVLEVITALDSAEINQEGHIQELLYTRFPMLRDEGMNIDELFFADPLGNEQAAYQVIAADASPEEKLAEVMRRIQIHVQHESIEWLNSDNALPLRMALWATTDAGRIIPPKKKSYIAPWRPFMDDLHAATVQMTKQPRSNRSPRTIIDRRDKKTTALWKKAITRVVTAHRNIPASDWQRYANRFHGNVEASGPQGPFRTLADHMDVVEIANTPSNFFSTFAGDGPYSTVNSYVERAYQAQDAGEHRFATIPADTLVTAIRIWRIPNYIIANQRAVERQSQRISTALGDLLATAPEQLSIAIDKMTDEERQIFSEMVPRNPAILFDVVQHSPAALEIIFTTIDHYSGTEAASNLAAQIGQSWPMSDN